MKRFKDFGMATALMVLLLGIAAASFAGNKSPMFSRQSPGGMFGVINETQTTGDIWFVNSATGTNAAGYGMNPDSPFASVAYALTQCAASQGDWIVVMPGHTETVATASAVSLSKAGVRVIGLGEGINRPVFNWTSKTATVGIDAASVTLENLVFDITPGTAGYAATGVTFAGTATDTKFKNCLFLLNNGAGVVTYAISATTGATRTQIDGCTFLGDGAGSSGVSSVVYVSAPTSHDIQIKNSVVYTYSSNPAIYVTSAVSGFQVKSTDVTNTNALSCMISATSAEGYYENVLTAHVAGVTKTTAAKASTSVL